MGRFKPLGFRDAESVFLLCLLSLGILAANVVIIILSLLMIAFVHPSRQENATEAI